MTDKQRRFAFEYLKDCNGTQAAIRAGYSEKTAYSQAERLLRKVEIQELIAELRDTLEDEAILEYNEACKVLSSVMRGNVADYLDQIGQIDMERLRTHHPEAVAGIKQRTISSEDGKTVVLTEFRLLDRIKACERLAKLKGWDRPARTEVEDVTPPRYNLDKLSDKQLEQFEKLLELVTIKP